MKTKIKIQHLNAHPDFANEAAKIRRRLARIQSLLDGKAAVEERKMPKKWIEGFWRKAHIRRIIVAIKP